MSKTVRRRHNRDGSVTQTTTYRRRNIFGTTISDTYTERIEPTQRQPRPATKLRTSNAVAIILLVTALFVISITGASINCSPSLIFGITKFFVVAFIAFMMFNNIPPLKKLFIRFWNSNKAYTIGGCGVFAIIAIVAIGVTSDKPAKGTVTDDIPINTMPTTQAISSETQEETTAETEEIISYAEDVLVNKFINEYNNISEYPMADVSKGNIRTKYHCTANDCWIEIINAKEAAAESFSVSIDGGNSDDSKEKIIPVFRDAIKVLDATLTDEQIEGVVTEIAENDKTIGGYSLGENIIITYVPSKEKSWGRTDCRIDISAKNYSTSLFE